jgi:hypothetical protein
MHVWKNVVVLQQGHMTEADELSCWLTLTLNVHSTLINFLSVQLVLFRVHICQDRCEVPQCFHLTVFPSLFGEHSKTGKMRFSVCPYCQVTAYSVNDSRRWETLKNVTPDPDSTILITSGIKKLWTYGWTAMARNGIVWFWIKKGGEDKVKTAYM